MQNNDAAVSPASWDDLWRTVGESFLGGIHHALNNRVAALSAIAQVLGAGMPDATPLVAALSGEVERLEQTVALISHLRRSRARTPEPIQLPELVASLLPILPQHGDLKEIEFVADPGPGIIPVYAERDLLTRVLLVLMTSAGVSADCLGGGRVRVSFTGDDVAVTARIACEPAANDRRGPVGDGTARLDAHAASEAVREMLGEMRTVESASGTGYELRLPTLLTARRNEGA